MMSPQYTGEMQQAGEITGLLVNWRKGNRAALDRLIPLVRKELSHLAGHHLGRMRNSDRMQPSSLVEAFLRLLPDADAGWRNRSHFFAVASLLMRHVVVDYARARRSDKRGGAAVHVPVDAAVVLSSEQLDQIVAVDLALERLARTDEHKSKVLEMRFFGGLSVEETAEVFGVAPNTVIRDWNFARAWLRRELSGGGVPNSGTTATG